jgi:branched-chain amino acid transport system permease protein
MADLERSGRVAALAETARAARSRRWRTLKFVAGLIVGFAFLAAPAIVLSGSSYWLYVASLTLVYMLGAAGLNLIVGYAGQISLAQAAFMGLGGYSVAILTVSHGWPVLPALAVGATVGFALGLLIGIPALRVTTHYLAMITLGVEVIYLVVATSAEGLTNGALGIPGIPRPSVGGLVLRSDGSYHLFVAAVVMLVFGFLLFVLNSTWGRAFKAVRENEMRASMLGVNVRRYKLLAFAIGCAVAAIAGGLLASLIGFVDPDTFPMSLSFQMLLMVVVGGQGRFEGPLLGAVLITVLPELLRGTANLYLIIFAALTLVVVVFQPKGLVALWDLAYRRVCGRPAPQLTK